MEMGYKKIINPVHSHIIAIDISFHLYIDTHSTPRDPISRMLHSADLIGRKVIASYLMNGTKCLDSQSIQKKLIQNMDRLVRGYFFGLIVNWPILSSFGHFFYSGCSEYIEYKFKLCLKILFIILIVF